MYRNHTVIQEFFSIYYMRRNVIAAQNRISFSSNKEAVADIFQYEAEALLLHVLIYK